MKTYNPTYKMKDVETAYWNWIYTGRGWNNNIFKGCLFVFDDEFYDKYIKESARSALKKLKDWSV
jgi:hypothetical protein